MDVDKLRMSKFLVESSEADRIRIILDRMGVEWFDDGLLPNIMQGLEGVLECLSFYLTGSLLHFPVLQLTEHWVFRNSAFRNNRSNYIRRSQLQIKFHQRRYVKKEELGYSQSQGSYNKCELLFVEGIMYLNQLQKRLGMEEHGNLYPLLQSASDLLQRAIVLIGEDGFSSRTFLPRTSRKRMEVLPNKFSIKTLFAKRRPEVDAETEEVWKGGILLFVPATPGVIRFNAVIPHLRGSICFLLFLHCFFPVEQPRRDETVSFKYDL
ncbi:unnamed protein product [Darwinula stevensoni]|uniref:Uncharacterized protein n=1 Tax=Darwinula stevensoni TaxID=69355 RepID=A0A7R9A461_9CRUS|nr:unnamed protein product [Darwinula stevensoni]CAG0891894.1 unnamed protein product [Darwinula stevensoni]